MINLQATLKAAKDSHGAAFEKVKSFEPKIEARAFDDATDGPLFEAAKTELEKFAAEIGRIQVLVDAEQRSLGFNLIGKRKRDTESDARKRFSLSKFLLGVATGKMEGFEAEMNEQGLKEARDASLSVVGAMIPTFVGKNPDTPFGEPESRDLLVGTTTAGGHLVATELNQLIQFLDPNLVTRKLGARYLTDLVGHQDFPRKTARATGGWVTEVATATESSPTFDKITMTPKRVSTFIEASLQMITQGNLSVENMVRDDLNECVSRAIDFAALFGTGLAPVPAGIVLGSTGTPSVSAGVSTVALGAAGAVPTWANMVDMESQVAGSDALNGKMGYLMHPLMSGKLKTVARDAVAGGYIWEGRNDMGGSVNGYPALTSSLVPKVLVKGASGAVCHAILFGNWNELLIGRWGGVNVVVDPYTRAADGIIKFTINSFFDVALRHGASFAAILDAKTS